MAFHLGCLRALQDRSLLNQVTALSSASGGSVIAAMYAYSDDSFEGFERRVVETLRKGFVAGIARETFLSFETPKIAVTVLTAGVLATVGTALSMMASLAVMVGLDRRAAHRFSKSIQAPLRRRASRTTAFERHLRKLFGDRRVDQVQRPRLVTVINATELRTGTAFRFGSKGTRSWRFGELQGEAPRVSFAVAASAAYPLLLPALDEVFSFDQRGRVSRERVLLTDGGVYDNLGLSCLLPGRDDRNTVALDVDFIICCDAGQGQPTGTDLPYTWAARLAASFATTHRRTHTMAYNLLHRLSASGEIKGFLLPYLGQIDARLANAPVDLVARNEVYDYPTDFNPMLVAEIELLAKRGEQLTHALIERYHPAL